MATALQLIERLRKIDTQYEVENAFNENKTEAADQIRHQLDQGIKGDGKAITPPYAASTVRRKRRKGQETSFVNLQDKREYYNALAMQADNNKVYGLGDEKTGFLEGRYGKEINIMNSESRAEFIRTNLKPAFIKSIKEKTGLK